MLMKTERNCLEWTKYPVWILYRYILHFIVPYLFFQIGCYSPTHKINPSGNIDLLREQIASLAADPNLFNAQIGIYIESLPSGEIIYQQNEHKLFIPASNMKVFTTATALLKFGSKFKYRTEIYNDGKIEQGVLRGNLIVKGRGDPTLAPRYYDGDVRKVFHAWVDSLQACGIQEIRGNLIGDESYFQGEPLGTGWQWDYEPFWYAAQISALTLNDNCIDVTVTPNDTIDRPPQISLMPPTRYVGIDNRARTILADSVQTLFLTRPRLQNMLQVENEIPVNKPPYHESISVENPALFFITVLAEVMTTRGITIQGSLITQKQPDQIPYNTCQRIFTQYSPELSEIIKVTNKVSQNLYTEQLLLTLAAEYGKKATASEGAAVVLDQMTSIGIPETEFLMVDGSGLSRNNLITPYAISTLLRFMARHSNFGYFYESLPVAGVDGTLKGRMQKTVAENRVHAKTGFVGRVRNLSGYAYSADDEPIIFSILVNNYTVPTSAINLLQDRICVLLSNFKR